MNEAAFWSQPHGRPLLQQEGQGWLHFVSDGAFQNDPRQYNGQSPPGNLPDTTSIYRNASGSPQLGNNYLLTL